MASMETFRPSFWDEIIGQDVAVDILKGLVAKSAAGCVFPNLLFHGSPGVGKTTSATVIARELLGYSWKDNFIEMNASDERKLDDVRERIKPIVGMSPLGGAPFRIIFLDEADALTTDAQHALRRIMESASGTARFILACNKPSKIIDALHSRCASIPFVPLSEEALKAIIKTAAVNQTLTVSEDEISSMARYARGDARRALHFLLKGRSEADKVIKLESMLDQFIAGLVDAETVVKFLKDGGYSEYEEVLEAMADRVVVTTRAVEWKTNAITDIGITAYRVNNVAVPLLQIRAMLYGWKK